MYYKYESPVRKAKQRDDFHHKSIEIIRKTMRNFMDWNVKIWFLKGISFTFSLISLLFTITF